MKNSDSQLYEKAAEDHGYLYAKYFSPFLLIICWICYCLLLVGWREVGHIMRRGGWVCLVLLGLIGTYAWASIAGPIVVVAGVSLPSMLEKFIVVAVMAGLAALCAFVQVRYKLRPARMLGGASAQVANSFHASDSTEQRAPGLPDQARTPAVRERH
jgi:hypothetical protein